MIIPFPTPRPRFAHNHGQLLRDGHPIDELVACALLDALHVAAFISNDTAHTIRISREARDLAGAIDDLNAWRVS